MPSGEQWSGGWVEDDDREKNIDKSKPTGKIIYKKSGNIFCKI